MAPVVSVEADDVEAFGIISGLLEVELVLGVNEA